MRKQLWTAAIVLLLGTRSAFGQQTTGNITGRVLDTQGVPTPGATVTAKNPETGFARTEVSDIEGIYRLTALPVGTYSVTAELPGFATLTRGSVEVNVAQTQNIDFMLRIAGVEAAVTVTGAPLIDTTSSSVGQVVDPNRIENLPLNGRQFANLAATVPGVGLGFHSDPTKSTQFAPYINGGAGRNIDYLIDGGDNNDDTVGGLLQPFPLEAIQEFNFATQRFKAEYGRSNGGVMNIITKSGTNQFQGSLFELMRDKALNAEGETERLTDAAATQAGRPAPGKGDYRRNQFGGSFGGPLEKDKAHFFVAIERTQQDTTQTMGAAVRALFPTVAGSVPLQVRENMVTGKVAVNLSPAQYLSIRYGHDDNTSPDNAGATHTLDAIGDSTNRFHSFNVNHNWVLGGSRLNEFIVQFSTFSNVITPRNNLPVLVFPNLVQSGTDPNAPQTTEQRKVQLRDDFSWHVTGHGGLGHDFKAGLNFINEPRLFITSNAAKGVPMYRMVNNDPNGPVSQVQVSDGSSYANVPNRQYGLYFQDDWRPAERLTLNLGVRYDLVTGMVFDQSLNPNFVLIQQAARAGLLNGIVGLENFGLDPRADRNNVQPRLGAVYDVRGDASDVIRGGWGMYTDFGYTDVSVLRAALDASGTHFGPIFQTGNSATGLRNADGSLYLVGQPFSNIASLNTATGASLAGSWADPRMQQPYQLQSNVGWSHELAPNITLSADFVNSLGRDLIYRPRLNQLIPGTTLRRISSLLPVPLNPDNSANRPTLSRGKSQYNALILSAHRRMSNGMDFTASYTLSRALSTIGNAYDEPNVGNVQDANNPFDAPVQMGPNRTTDARHRLTVSAVIALPYGFQVAPFYLLRSALPVFLIDGRDLNGDGEINDIPARAFAVGSVDPATGKATIKDIGPCLTVNCGRSSPESQFNLRVSKSVRLQGRLNIELIGEVYNLFNALNPATAAGRVTIPSGLLAGQQDPTLLQPQTFSGDNQRPSQRIGQIGLRVTF
jgi:hypothetical protein